MDDVRIHQRLRRAFLARAAGLGAAFLIGIPPGACAKPPPEVTRIRLIHVLVEKGYEPRHEMALAVLKNLSYNRWRFLERASALDVASLLGMPRISSARSPP